MRYKILGDSDCPLVHIQLDMNEKLKLKEVQWLMYLMSI